MPPLHRSRALKAVSLLLLLWLAGGNWLARHLAHKLQAAADGTVARLNTGALEGRFDHVTARWNRPGVLELAGRVRSEQDAARLVHAAGSTVRTPGNPFNPVLSVRWRDTLEVRPLGPGWLFFAARGTEARVIGVCASEAERAALHNGLRARWPVWSGSIRFDLEVDRQSFDESDRWQTTTDRLPPALSRADQTLLLATAIGGEWVELSGEDLDGKDPPEELRRLGMTAAHWASSGREMVRQVLFHRERAADREREAARIAALPPPHALLAMRNDLVLVCGEVHDATARRELLAAVMSAMPGKRVLDEVRARGSRRPGAPGGRPRELAELLAAAPAGRSAVAFGEDGWRTYPMAEDGARSWRRHLPGELPPEEVEEDARLIRSWARDGQTGVRHSPAPGPAGFVVLAVFGNRILVGGQVAEESTRAQILASVKAGSAGIGHVRDEITVNPLCPPANGLPHTLHSLPALSGQGVLAVAAPGRPWTAIPLHIGLLEPAGWEDAARAANISSDPFARAVYAQAREFLTELQSAGLDLSADPRSSKTSDTPAP